MIYKRQDEPQSVKAYRERWSVDDNATFVLDGDGEVILIIGRDVDGVSDNEPYEIVLYDNDLEGEEVILASVHDKEDIQNIIKALQDLIA